MDSTRVPDTGRVTETTQQAIPVFVVSLARAWKRREAVVAHLRSLGVAFELMDAVDGQTIPPEQRRAMQPEGVDHPPGVLGCYLSHMNIYRRMVAEHLPVALCLEDDARLNPAFVPALRKGLHSLDFDYCFLDYASENEGRPIYYNRDDAVEVHPGFRAYACHDGPGTTHAYFITGTAAAQRLKNEFPIHDAVDIYRHLPYRPRFRAFVSPLGAGASEESMDSLIGERRHAGQLSLRRLRRVPGFYTIRNLLVLDRYRLRFGVHALVRAGLLPASGRWRPLPPGRPILL